MSIDQATPEQWNAVKNYVDPFDKPKEDNINHPSHYNQGSKEFIDQLEETFSPKEFMGYLEGSLRKYIHRFNDKNPTNPAEDLRKARWFLDKMIMTVSKNQK